MQNDAVIQQVLDRIEKRIEQFDTMDKPTLKVIAAPVSPDRPIIQPSGIYDLYGNWKGAKRVSGGVCIFTEPSDDDPDKSIDPYTEFNEYGVVYYRSHFYKNSDISYFIHNINHLLKEATELYKACDASIDIRIHASMNNVFKEELSMDLGIRPSIRLYSKPMCYDSQVSVSTVDTYSSTNFDNVEYQKTILEGLTMRFLWAFNVPIENERLVNNIKNRISQTVGNSS